MQANQLLTSLVGSLVGDSVSITTTTGFFVSTFDGLFVVGLGVILIVGRRVGDGDGKSDGAPVGIEVTGLWDGPAVGAQSSYASHW